MPTAIVPMVYTLGHNRVKPCVERMPKAHTTSSRPETISTIQGQFIMSPDSLYREVLRAGGRVHIDALLSLSRAWRQRRPLAILSCDDGCVCRLRQDHPLVEANPYQAPGAV